MADELPRVTDAVFCPEVNEIQIAFLNLLPRGRAWGTHESLSQTRSDSVIRQFFKAIAISWKNFEDAMCQSFNEWYCATALYDKELWNLDYGVPDDCDLYNMNVCAKVGAIHSVDEDELISLLLSSGYQAEGRWLTGHDKEYPGVRSTLRIMVDPRLSTSVQVRTKLPHPVGRTLGAPDLNQIVCMLERYVPLHTVVDASISGDFQPTDLGTKLVAWWNADDAPLGVVTTWADRIGGVSLTPVNANTPTNAEDVTGRRFITLNGTNMALSANAGISAPGTDDTSLLVLIRYDGVSGDPDMVIGSIGTPSGSNPRTISRSSGNILRSAAQGVITSTPNFLNPLSVYANIGSLISTAGIKLRNLGERQATSAAIPGLNTAGSTVVFGADSAAGSPTQWLKGAYRHIFILRGATTHDATQLEAWSAWDVTQQSYLLPGDHPYANMRP